MSESEEEENFCLYGTPLDPLDDDEIPSKKPISIEDQIATDAYGRRRFHGAFTGGFSAGFYNTVGSLEGWAPKDFKSSRQEKATKYAQKPEDFMDDEDIAEHGFAPQGLRATDDYNSIKNKHKKRNLPPTSHPIPGQPVLQLLLEPVKETIGVKLLKQMGWKPGQGVGPRLTRSEKKKSRKKRVIGCEMPPEFGKKTYNSESDSESDSEDDFENITFAPDDYDPYICQPKEDSCGMGYKGLNKNALFSGFSKEPGHFTMVERNNKKLSIQGQAFGVGAFEEDDEDIYGKDDMSKYDFELGSNTTKPQQKALMNSMNILENFVVGAQTKSIRKSFPPPVLPKNFVPKHGVRISRFEPLSTEKLREVKRLTDKTVEKQPMNAEKRGQILGEAIQQPKDCSKESGPVFLEGGNIIKPSSILDETDNNIPKPRIVGDPLKPSEFKPFLADPDKQERYDKYLEFIKNNTKSKLAEIQPISMTDWERQREEHEFEQAAKMFKPQPTNFLVFDKFVTAQQQDDINNPLLAPVESVYLHGTPDMREAVKRKMFGKLTREEMPWSPGALLCKRFNIPEPNVDSLPSTTNQRKRKRNFSVFDYLNATETNQYNQGEMSKVQKVEDEGSKLKDKILEFQSENNNPTLPLSPSEEVLSSVPSTSQTNDVLNIIEDKMTEIPVVESIVEKEPITENIETVVDVKPTEKIVEDVVLHTETKIDLYKAIFLSSDDSESEKEDEPENSFKLINKPSLDDLFKNDLLSEVQSIQKNREKPLEVQTMQTSLEKSSEENKIPTEVKIDPPLASVKATGIFANIDLDALNRRPEYKRPENKTSDDIDVNAYGPKLPVLPPVKSMPTNFKTNNSGKETIKEKSDKEDMWIEKSSSKLEKNKHEKKSKKKSHKHKHKKSSKHKKKKHSDDSK